MTPHSRKRRHAFSLIELLVVIGIIALLIAVLLPVLGRARISALELRSQSGLRQMMIGYILYAQNNRGSLLFGYTPSTVDGAPVSVADPRSGQTFGTPVSQRYPWRLLPFVSNIWPIIHSHGDLPAIPAAGESSSQAFLDAYMLSLNPTYGINSVYVGGDANYQGFVGPNNSPNIHHHVVFKSSEVHSSSKLIIFADCRTTNVPSLAGQGLYCLTPPHASGHNWEVVNNATHILNPNLIMGVPQGWYSNRIMVSFFDGHVESMLPSQLDDMRLWANYATAPDYDYAF
ncbi:MAG TPA: type II secretion system protein [Tepidisphaeraceae bacterium]|jgi:prepilin-type N-terminal cleavage/methylation domain-containing protein/prepilin-type processing-associated H-X9-DG protein|nr:type II secretion system protein [Tepidisphaeraceae bacterium]